MATSKIILKYGVGAPLLLELAEPAYDTSSNSFHIGLGNGSSIKYYASTYIDNNFINRDASIDGGYY